MQTVTLDLEDGTSVQVPVHHDPMVPGECSALTHHLGECNRPAEFYLRAKVPAASGGGDRRIYVCTLRHAEYEAEGLYGIGYGFPDAGVPTND